MIVTLEMSERAFALLAGLNKSSVHRMLQKGEMNQLRTKSEPKVNQTLNASILKISLVDSESEPKVNQERTKGEPKQEKEREKEEFPPTPPIEEKEKEKENFFPSSLTNQRFARDTPQGATQNRGGEAISDTADSPMVVEGVRKKPTKKAPLKTMAQLEEETKVRAKDFYYSLVPYVATYGKEMIRDFYDYWSETNKSKTKMRWETEKTWVVNLRLRRWADNNKPQKRRYGTEWSDEDIARQRRADDAARVMQQFLNAE